MINLRDYVSKFAKKAKQNYKYFKMGRKAEFDERQKEIHEQTRRWMENIRKGTPKKNLKERYF